MTAAGVGSRTPDLDLAVALALRLAGATPGPSSTPPSPGLTGRPAPATSHVTPSRRAKQSAHQVSQP